MYIADLWFGEECPGIEEKDVLTQYGYLSGDELILYGCDVTKGDYSYTVIGGISYADNGDIVVYYTFHYKNAGSLSGRDGTAEAYFQQDSEGKYYLYNIEIVTEVPYSYD